MSDQPVKDTLTSQVFEYQLWMKRGTGVPVMVAGLPAEEAVDIFNELVRIAPSEVDRIGRAEWRLRAMVRQRPNDTVVGVAHLQALIMLGSAREALDLAGRLWPLRRDMLDEQRLTYLTAITHLGMYERGSEMLTEEGRAPGSERIWRAIEVGVFWGLGDIERLAAVIDKTPTSYRIGWKHYLDELVRSGLAKYMPARQKIARARIFGWQTFSELRLDRGEHLPMEIQHYAYGVGEYPNRLKIEDEIHSQLDSFFAPLGLASIHWDLISEIVVPITAAPPPHEGFYQLDAA